MRHYDPSLGSNTRIATSKQSHAASHKEAHLKLIARGKEVSHRVGNSKETSIIHRSSRLAKKKNRTSHKNSILETTSPTKQIARGRRTQRQLKLQTPREASKSPFRLEELKKDTPNESKSTEATTSRSQTLIDSSLVISGSYDWLSSISTTFDRNTLKTSEPSQEPETHDTSLSFTKYREKTASLLTSLVSSSARSENTDSEEEILKMMTKSTMMNTQNLSNSKNLSIVETNLAIVGGKMPFKYERGAPTLKSDENS